MPWCVLQSSAGYLGQKWEVMNTALRRPRLALVDLQAASPFHESTCREDASRGSAVLGVEFRPVPIAFVDRLDERGRRIGVELQCVEES